MSKKKKSFREELERLETIVRTLEEEDIELDEALQLFEEGVRRLKDARALLEESDLTVKRVLEAADGTLRAKNLDR
ncbi:MAG: exodeoxyribonuclease VII small subunit [Gemmatimonadota bacterium]|nr:exodeoxyribonuclease VII small subunit [Gemmatimonadota bacterium]